MIRPSITLVATALFMMTCSVVGLAQKNNPLDYDYDRSRIGLDIGLVSTWQSGVYTAGCGRFEKGARINPLIGLVYDNPITSTLRFEALVGFQGRGLTSSYNSRENVVVKTSDNQLLRANVDFDNQGSANFSYIFVMPSIRWSLTKAIFVGAGLSGGFLVNATTQYTKNITSKVVQVGDLGLAEVSYPQSETTDPYSKVFPEETRNDAKSMAIDAAAYAGIEFLLTQKLPKLHITPRVVYTIPFTAVLESDDDLKINTLQLLIGVRWNLD